MLNTTNSYTEQTDILQNAAGADGNGTSKTLTPNTIDMLVIVTGASGVLTVNLEMSRDGGSTWVAAVVEDILATSPTLLSTVVNPIAETLYHFKQKPGYNRFRARISGFVSGTATITVIERRLV